jgi:hypothetical protein
MKFCHKKIGKAFVLSYLQLNICALKKENELRKLLGICQIEMGMLLQIRRSWGKRSLMDTLR